MHSSVVSFAYYTSWAAYGREHYPWQVPVQGVTHVSYAFARVGAETLTAELCDPWIDVQKVYAENGDRALDSGPGLHGNLGRLLDLKRHNAGLKVGVALGGWSDSKHLSDAMATPECRARLAASLVDMAADHGLDYVDIDWEFPVAGGNAGNSHCPEDGLNMVLLGREVLAQAEARSLPLYLTAAVPAVTAALQGFRLAEMAAVFRYILVMVYDMCGAWAGAADHHGNLQGRSPHVPSGADAVAYILRSGVPAAQVVLGVPLYGRSYAGCAGLGMPFSGVGPGKWEPGVLDLKALPLPGHALHWDEASRASYSHDPESQVLVSHESVESLRAKMDFVDAQGLAGLMAWETSGDYPRGDERSFFGMVERRFGDRLDRSPGVLAVPSSQYVNVRTHCSLSPKTVHRQANEESDEKH